MRVPVAEHLVEPLLREGISVHDTDIITYVHHHSFQHLM